MQILGRITGNWFVTLGALAAVACSSNAPKGSTPGTTPDPATTTGTASGHKNPNEPPTMEIPAYKVVGIGQEIGFGIEVVDEESDTISIELVQKPASAHYDPYTLTVTWKPTAEDMPAGHFAARVTETQRGTGTKRVALFRFSINVTKEAQPELHAQPLGPVVETLITIHDSTRLAEVNARWPLDKILLRAAELEVDLLPDAERTKVAKPDADTLYRTFLKQLAVTHDNPAVDPDSPKFDRAKFGNPKDWKIIAIRPRLDKKWHEVRIVYKATKAHEATYTMFKFRPVDDGKLPPEALAFNNKEFTRLVFEAFFKPDGTLHPLYVRNKAEHAKRVAWFVDSVINYENKAHAWAKGTFLALPTEARLGGGSVRGADGAYASGDGWAWNVMKIKPHNGKMELVNIPIKGFATSVVPNADGTAWQMKCGSRFDADDDAHNPGSQVLCRKSGHVDLPGTGDGYADAEAKAGSKIRPSFKDAAHMFIDHKRKHMVATVPLRDPRRDLFEEKGMTCHQCHVRKFGVRDMYDKAAYDPRAGTPNTLNKKQATSYFVLVPTVSWQPYMIDFQHKQECKFAVAFEKDIGKKTSLTCPLKAE